jgi:hypothetical protein
MTSKVTEAMRNPVDDHERQENDGNREDHRAHAEPYADIDRFLPSSVDARIRTTRYPSDTRTATARGANVPPRKNLMMV